ncbi:MAG: carboxyl-terminal processing protease [Chitinophagales bacterium]|jgi:carboxyl-terminal processing protease
MMNCLRLRHLLSASALMLMVTGGPILAQTEVEVDALEKTPIPLSQIRTFAEIFTRIKLNYVEPISDEQLLEYAIEGMLSGLDPHSVYLKGDRYNDLNEGTTGAFSGLGMEVIMEDGFVKVVAPIDDTPAAEAGIMTGDLIIRMDGKTVSGLSLSEATERMRGEPGTKITITILRESEPDPLDVELTRALVRLNSVKRKRLSDSIGYLRVTQFQIATAENFRKELKQLRESEGFEGLVLDLRNNPGGLLTSAISIADVFIDEGLIVSTKGRSGTIDQDYRATPSDFIDGKPLVVLINGGSASASEIVAGALQDHGRALILGTDSFGKGSVQTVLNIDDKEAIKLTTARYYTPNGRSIQAEGIKPDVLVEYREFKDREKGFKRIKEDDLPGRLDNDSDKGSSKDSGKKESLETPTKKQEEAQQLLARDYQLNEAFNLLNGLILFKNKVKKRELISTSSDKSKSL